MSIKPISSGAVTTIETEEKELSLFVTSDVHFDSVYCNRKLFFYDLDRAVEQGAMIVIIGDLFDAMNGRFDPRRDMSALRPEYRRADYYDYLVDDAAKKLEKYVPHFSLITPGNHELSVLKNANTYLSDRLVSKLNGMGGNIIHGGYGGWLRIVFKNGRKRFVVKIKYFHGSGGEAPVTRGAIQTSRQAVFLPDADVVLNGHSHNQYWIPITRERLSTMGVHYFDTQHHVRTPGYSQAYGDGTTGWEVTRGGVPKPLGGCFIKMKYTHDRVIERQDVISIVPLSHDPVPISPVNDMFDGVVFPQE